MEYEALVAAAWRYRLLTPVPFGSVRALLGAPADLIHGRLAHPLTCAQLAFTAVSMVAAPGSGS